MHIISENIYQLEEGELLACWQQFLEGNSDAFGKIISCYYAALFQYGIKIHADKAFVQDSSYPMMVMAPGGYRPEWKEGPGVVLLLNKCK